MITLYDFETALPGKGLSLFVWRIRFALNIKGLKHKTEWISYSNVAKLGECGFPPSETRPDGTPRYTVPSIFDSTTNRRLSGSHAILKYLDEAYPNTPQLCTLPSKDSSNMVASAFASDWSIPEATIDPTWGLLAPTIITKGLDRESAAKYTANFEAFVSSPLEEFMGHRERRETFRVLSQEAFSAADSWLVNACEGQTGPWILGDHITLPDIVMCSCLAWILSAVGEDGEEWKWVTQEWDGGRWGARWENIKSYSQLY